MCLQLVIFAQFSQNLKKCLIRITEKYSSGAYIFTTISFFTEKTIGLLEILKKTFVSVSLKFLHTWLKFKVESK